MKINIVNLFWILYIIINKFNINDEDKDGKIIKNKYKNLDNNLKIFNNYFIKCIDDVLIKDLNYEYNEIIRSCLGVGKILLNKTISKLETNYKEFIISIITKKLNMFCLKYVDDCKMVKKFIIFNVDMGFDIRKSIDLNNNYFRMNTTPNLLKLIIKNISNEIYNLDKGLKLVIKTKKNLLKYIDKKFKSKQLQLNRIKNLIKNGK